MIRTFFAIPIPSSIRECIGDFQAQLRKLPVDVKWVRPKSIHITLKFLGDIPVSKIDELAEAVYHAVKGVNPFAVSVKGTGTFPNPRRPRVFWIGINQGGELLSLLARQIDEALQPLGFPPEKRDFSPHMTIGRVRSLSNINDAVQTMNDIGFAEQTFAAKAIEFLKSDLKPTGAEYTVLKEIHL